MSLARTHRRSFSIRTALVALVAVPLLALSVVAGSVLGGARRDVAAYEDIRDHVEEVAELARLQSTLSVETFWGSAVASLDTFGFDPEVLGELLGVDVVRAYGDARSEVDAALRGPEHTGLADRVRPGLEAARSGDGDATDTVRRYQETEEAVRQRLDVARSTTASAITSADTPTEMSGTFEAIDHVIDLRDHVGSMATNLFGLRFPSNAVGADPAADLIRADASYRETRSHLERAVPDGDPLAQELDAIEAEAQVAVFLDAVDGAIARLAQGGIEGLPLDLDAEIDAFLGSLVAIDRASDLVTDAADQLADVARSAEREALRDRQVALVVVAVAVALSVLTAFLVSRWIDRPLRTLAATAGDLDRGDLDSRTPVEGPSEVRAAASALNSAVRHLQVAEHQALALAKGDVDAAKEVDGVPGRLGESLRIAMHRLASSIDEGERFREELHHEATHDTLTGLPNRSAIIAELAEALASGTGVAVLFVDLNGFKRINDQNGHAAGDEVLRTVADRIRTTTRDSDVIGRLGGDEFVVVAEGVDLREATELARRVRDAVARPVPTAHSTVTPGASVGVAITDGRPRTPDELLRDADLAVYRAKDLDGGVAVCDEALRREVERRYRIEGELARAIADDALELHYQPVVEARSGRPVGFEALVRWPLPDGTYRQPAEFVPVAETGDLISLLDQWVVERACRQLVEWSADPVLADLPVSVNVSARDVSDRSFTDHVIATVATAGLDPGRLVVELTESALLEDVDNVRGRLDSLRRSGIRVAIDDFGTGYTSLGVLRELPIDVLKLDRSLIERSDRDRDAAILGLIITTAHQLGMSLTAEGVQEPAQADRLARLGSDHLQGFLISPALPPGRVGRWCHANAASASAGS